MDDILRYASISIPNWWVFISFSVLSIGIVGSVIACKDRTSLRKSIILLVLAEYIFLVLCVTIFCRPSIGEPHIRLMPFTTYIDFFTTEKSYLPAEILEEISMNVLMFLPIGVLLTCLSFNYLQLILSAISLSFVIELLQFKLCRGCGETNDIIHNTLGAWIGFSIMRLLIKTIRKN